ncbi:unnamed protein product [Caenorhabditis angaria]|uniref:Integrase zinc-binding domain-containing protein n=1 Tax=Caenorhabditis angaria TaxID=860376 RepID=A0A9P1ISH6_9PELO|nr:unnamed protein product [Caenorhabditis angaria]
MGKQDLQPPQPSKSFIKGDEKNVSVDIWDQNYIKKIQSESEEIMEIREKLRQGDGEESKLYENCNGLIRKKLSNGRKAFIIPNNKVEVDKIIKEIHQTVYLGAHFGVSKTETIIRRKFYWYGMKKDIKKYIGGCYKCRASKIKDAKEAIKEKIKEQTPKPQAQYQTPNQVEEIYINEGDLVFVWRRPSTKKSTPHLEGPFKTIEATKLNVIYKEGKKKKKPHKDDIRVARNETGESEE